MARPTKLIKLSDEVKVAGITHDKLSDFSFMVVAGQGFIVGRHPDYKPVVVRDGTVRFIHG